ncbi:MAG: sulfatase [candidate division KSB1 bacterium]|nr:sulfatase [candidate division KSB1 bacterium]
MKLHNPDRRDFIKKTGLGLAGMALGGPAVLIRSRPQRPNILFIMTDDHAAHAISAYGSRINRTPNIDRLAHDGMRFANCFCVNSICAPSRASMLTGLYSHAHGVIDNRTRLDSSKPMFPQLLRRAGYETALVGKWHLKTDPTGFDYWNVLPGQGMYYNPDFIEMGERKPYTGYATDVTTDIALDWLERRDRRRPFCLLLHHKAPHRNWMPGPKQLHLYRDRPIPEPPNLFDDYTGRGPAAHMTKMTIAEHMYPAYDLKLPLDPANEQDAQYWQRMFGRLNDQQRQQWEAAYRQENEQYLKHPPTGKERVRFFYQRYIKDYLRCVASVDENVGRVLDFLDEKELAENTLVVYSSDQGFFLGEHGWYDKRFMYEESLRVPLLMRWPGVIGAGAMEHSMVLNVDFAPTILEAAGARIPRSMHGRSFLAMLQGRRLQDWRTAMYYHYYEFPNEHGVRPHYGIRTERYKLIRFYGDIDAWELFDLEKDPQEMRSVHAHPDYAGIRDRLTAQLYAMQKTLGDRGE